VGVVVKWGVLLRITAEPRARQIKRFAAPFAPRSQLIIVTHGDLVMRGREGASDEDPKMWHDATCTSYEE